MKYNFLQHLNPHQHTKSSEYKTGFNTGYITGIRKDERAKYKANEILKRIKTIKEIVKLLEIETKCISKANK